MKKQLLIAAAFCLLAAPTAAVASTGDHGLCHFVAQWHWLDWMPCHS